MFISGISPASLFEISLFCFKTLAEVARYRMTSKTIRILHKTVEYAAWQTRSTCLQKRRPSNSKSSAWWCSCLWVTTWGVAKRPCQNSSNARGKVWSKRNWSFGSSMSRLNWSESRWPQKSETGREQKRQAWMRKASSFFFSLEKKRKKPFLRLYFLFGLFAYLFSTNNNNNDNHSRQIEWIFFFFNWQEKLLIIN